VTDEKLLELSMEMDRMLLKTADKYQTSALLLCSAILARLVLLNDAVGSGTDFRRLLLSISNTPTVDQDEVSLH